MSHNTLRYLPKRGAGPLRATLRRRAQSGFSLVELMVAMVIGLFLTSAIVAAYVSTSSATQSSTLQAELNENGSLALQILQQQLKLTGYSNVNATGVPNFTGVAVFGCDSPFTAANGDYFGGTGTPCGSGTGDAIAVRYEADAISSYSTAGTSATSSCTNATLNNWATSAASTGYALAENRFYIQSNSLYCIGREGSGGFGTETELIPNIEDLKVQYVVTAPMNATYVPHQVTARVDATNAVLGTTLANWRRVAGVNICVLVRSASPAPKGDLTDAEMSRYIDCDGNTDTSKTDRYLRRAFHTSVQFRNLRPGIASTVPTSGATNSDPWTALKSGS
jgi:type IV pilus assembly protein PilW